MQALTIEPDKKEARMADGKLTAKQELFVAEYLKDLNATNAAIRAGYSEKSAHSTGPRMLENAGVAAAIQTAISNRSAATKIDAEWVIKRLVAEAEADVLDLYDEDGKIKPISEWPLIWRQGLVAGVETDELFEGQGEDRERVGTRIKVRLSDRIRRIELIGKHVNVQAFKEQVAVSGLDDLAARLARAKKR